MLEKYLVTFDEDDQNLRADFDTAGEAYDYALENVGNIPSVLYCYQSDEEDELGLGVDYEEENITFDNEELADALDKILN